MKRAALLARVSTGNQKKGSSPEDQIDRTRAYAQKQGYEIVDQGLDVISGSFILARTTFNRYLEMMSEGQLDVIVVDIPDRLGRGDAIAKCELLAQLNGGRIEYATPGRDESTIEGMAMKMTDSLVSGIERINIRRRTMNGKKKWAQKGRIIASPFRTYGYNYHKDYDPRTGEKVHCDLILNKEEAEIVVKIFEWCAYAGWTTHRIAKELTKMEVLTLSDKEPQSRRKKRGKKTQWHKDTIYGMLTNTTYKGEWRYLKNRVKRIDTVDGIRTEVSKRDESEMIVIDVPAIVSPELWQLAQDRLKESARRSHKPTKYNYLLRGRIRCGECGGAMAGVTRVYKGNRNWRYRCIRKYQFGVNLPGSCSTRNVPGPKVEQLVWDYLVNLLLNEEVLFGKIESQREEKKLAEGTIKHNIVSLEAENRKDKEKLERYLELYGEGGLSKAGYLAKKKKIQEAIDKRMDNIAEWKQRLREVSPLSPDAEAELRRIQLAIGKRLEKANFEQKQYLLSLLQVKCIYHDDTGQLVMSGIFGTETLSITETDESDDEKGGNGGEGNGNEDKNVSHRVKHLHITDSFEQFSHQLLPLFIHLDAMTNAIIFNSILQVQEPLANQGKRPCALFVV